MSHVKNNSGNNEWYTPSEFVESARFVMGGINLDPASSIIANQTVKADRFYSIEDDGLSQDWTTEALFINPPYGRDLIGKFIDKLISSNVKQAIVMVNNATETQWGSKLLLHSKAVCFITKRVKFITPEGIPLKSPLQGQMVCYIGNNPIGFKEEFSQYGVVLINN